jgi:chromate transporter
MMEQEVVSRRKWLTRQHFLDLVGATNLIPGPNSTEMAMHVGFLRAGWLGLIVAGASFIFPAATITAVFAWFYVEFGTLPQVAPFLYGIRPVVIALILGAVWKLGRTATGNWRVLALELVVGAASLLGGNEIVVLLLGGLVGMLWLRFSGRNQKPANVEKSASERIGEKSLGAGYKVAFAVAVGVALVAFLGDWLTGSNVVSPWGLAFSFLKIGSVLYGSGYVLVAFLDGELVRGTGWLSRSQLLDAIAMGQFTPGPVLSAATFIGYVILGVPGAIISTVAIFLPSFFFTAALNPLVPRLRRSAWASAFLDAVNASSVALMASVVVKLAAETMTTWPAVIIVAGAAIVSLRTKINPSLIVLGGILAGWLLTSYMP